MFKKGQVVLFKDNYNRAFGVIESKTSNRYCLYRIRLVHYNSSIVHYTMDIHENFLYEVRDIDS